MKEATKAVAAAPSKLDELMQDESLFTIPKLGDTIKGKVLSTKGREIRIDILGLTTGVVRGRELYAEAETYKNLKDGDEVEATVVELENENGEVELSFRFAGQQRAWKDLSELSTSGEPIPVKVLDANKGGLIVRVNHVQGFLPVSQLAPEHYPRVAGGDKQKIFEKLRSYWSESGPLRGMTGAMTGIRSASRAKKADTGFGGRPGVSGSTFCCTPRPEPGIIRQSAGCSGSISRRRFERTSAPPP